MTDKYRKLDADEVRALYNQLAGSYTKPTRVQMDILNHVRKYYPASACSASLTIRSEYNDNTYDNSAGALVVWDKNNNEIVPWPATARESRELWTHFNVPCESTEEHCQDIVVHMAPKTIPDLYIKGQ